MFNKNSKKNFSKIQRVIMPHYLVSTLALHEKRMDKNKLYDFCMLLIRPVRQVDELSVVAKVKGQEL